MSLQVGLACYADAAAAGGAACSSFGNPITSLASGQIQALSCVASDPVTGALTIQSSTAAVGFAPVVSTTIIQPVYPPCVYGDWMDAGIAIAVSVLTIWASLHGYRLITEYMHWGRAND